MSDDMLPCSNNKSSQGVEMFLLHLHMFKHAWMELKKYFWNEMDMRTKELPVAAQNQTCRCTK
jgi:hypothetical protein